MEELALKVVNANLKIVLMEYVKDQTKMIIAIHMLIVMHHNIVQKAQMYQNAQSSKHPMKRVLKLKNVLLLIIAGLPTYKIEEIQ